MMMQDFGGGLESFTPGEGAGSASEALSEDAKQRFAAAQAQVKQMMKEEKKAKKKDDSVANTIIQFLGDERYAHLFPLISRLAARDCPSIFILALLSLIHEPSRKTVEEYIAENKVTIAAETATTFGSHLSAEVRQALLLWVSCLSLVMKIDGEKILRKLLIDEGNIDGAALQLMTFSLRDFLKSLGSPAPLEQLQPIATGILQTVMEPYLDTIESIMKEREVEPAVTDDDED